MSINLYQLLTEELQLSTNAFKNQVIVVTGAGQGIGFHTARAFAFLGGKVVIAELSENGKHAECNIRAEGGEATFFQTDVSNPDSGSHLYSFVKKELGQATVLINNAIYIDESPVVEMSTDMWNRTITTNLRGAFLTCRTFLPDMITHNVGTIINMISTNAMPGLSAYIASKMGILGFTQSLAQELQGTGIKVIPFGPGMVDTPGIRKIAGGLAPRLGLSEAEFLNTSLHQAYKGLMPPEHAAAAVVYLALFLADEFHGQEVNGYEVLERAGVLSVEMPESTTLVANAEKTEISQEMLMMKIEQILKDTEGEFKDLPTFARPMAKQGFKNKAGMSLSDWQRTLSNFESGEPSSSPNLYEKLNKLAKYYREVPQEMARFTNDENFLREVMKTTEHRLKFINAFQETLK